MGGTDWETTILRRSSKPPEYRFGPHGVVVDPDGLESSLKTGSRTIVYQHQAGSSD